jgi:predicted dehydrogenase
MVVTLDFRGGATGTLTSIWHDIEARGSLRRVEVFCERRWVALEHDWTGPVRWTDAGGGGGVLDRDALGFGENPDGAFVEAARAGGPAWPDFDVGVRAHEVADAIYRSAAAGGLRVAVPGEAG